VKDNDTLIATEKLRQTSLLGSATFMRILASASQTLISKDTGISARLFHRTAQHATAADLAHTHLAALTAAFLLTWLKEQAFDGAVIQSLLGPHEPYVGLKRGQL
jgi:hypothetical protein